MRAFLGLGANLAQPEQQVRDAIKDFSASCQLSLLQVSPLYASAPMGPRDQPDYINAVVEIETHLEPFALLDLCQSIEKAHQRERGIRWGARTLDIDILSIDEIILNSDRLILPHVGIASRDFVVLPWCDIAPDYIIPMLGAVSQIQLSASFAARRLSSLDGVSTL